MELQWLSAFVSNPLGD